MLLLFSAEKIVGQTVSQTEGTVTVTEGQPVFLNCTYDQTIDYQPNPFWYIQYLGEPPTLFQSTFSTPNLGVGLPQNFLAVHNKAGKTFHMTKSASQLNDSAIYLCAVRNTVRRGRREADQKLADSWVEKMIYLSYNPIDNYLGASCTESREVSLFVSIFSNLGLFYVGY